MVSDDGLRAAKEKMRAEGVPDAAIATFDHYYEQLVAGESGMLPDDDLEQLSDVPGYDDLPGEEDREALDKAVVIKLNGGLGTSMGMEKAKSLLEVKEGRSFLDIIAGQVLELREQHGARLPLVLMNSFYTREDTLAALERHPELESDVPADFVQNKEPKLRVDDLTPGRVARRPRARVVPAGPRRRLHGAADLGHARHAAREGLRVRVPLQLGQPRRRARPARSSPGSRPRSCRS